MNRTRLFHPIPLLVAIATITASCVPGEAERPNILLISLDTLRADHVGSYGYERDTTPFLDELAERGARFRWAFVNTLATTNSHASILSSQYQESHGVQFTREEDNELSRLPENLPMVQEAFRDAGYLTLAVTDGGNFAARHGFDRGFDEFQGDRSKGVARGSEAFLRMLDEHSETSQPLFLLFHTYEIHAPYDPPPPFDTSFPIPEESDFVPTARNLRRHIQTANEDLTAADMSRVVSLYDGGIRYTDSVLEDLFDELETRGLFERDFLVVVTSDHGEEFGERGGVLHRGLLYDEFIRVPLIMVGSRVPAGLVRDDIVSSVDIAPTMLAYAGIDIPESMQGHDLFARRRRAALGERTFAQLRDRRYAVREKRWKLIEEPNAVELYDLLADPGETDNLAQENPEKVSELRQALASWRTSQEGRRLEAGSGELSPEELEELKALGYVD